MPDCGCYGGGRSGGTSNPANRPNLSRIARIWALRIAIRSSGAGKSGWKDRVSTVAGDDPGAPADWAGANGRSPGTPKNVRFWLAEAEGAAISTTAALRDLPGNIWSSLGPGRFGTDGGMSPAGSTEAHAGSERLFGGLDLRARPIQATGLLFLPLPVPSGDHGGCLSAANDLAPKPMKTNCLTTLALAALAASTLTANASSVITSYETVTGARDGNQAGPMWGQFITPDIGSTGGPHGTLYLQSLSYQAADDGTRQTAVV